MLPSYRLENLAWDRYNKFEITWEFLMFELKNIAFAVRFGLIK